MLRQRVITALILLPPVLAAVLLLSDFWLAWCLAGVAALAAREWATLAGRAGYGNAIYTLAVALAAGLLADGRTLPAVVPQAVLLLAVAAWISAPLGWGYLARHAAASRATGWGLAAGALWIPAAAIGLVDARAGGFGSAGLGVLLALVWAADIAAYFGGRAWGRHRLAPALSPGKTWEGFVAGLAGALAVGTVAGVWLLSPPRPWLGWLVLCLLTATSSVVGDLSESLLKRLAGVKDSGTLLPGHGGVLDRIDSLIAAAPVFAVGMCWLGR